jgi:hypothetical protein
VASRHAASYGGHMTRVPFTALVAAVALAAPGCDLSSSDRAGGGEPAARATMLTMANVNYAPEELTPLLLPSPSRRTEAITVSSASLTPSRGRISREPNSSPPRGRLPPTNVSLLVSAVEVIYPGYGLLLPFNGGVALRHDGLYLAVVEGPQHAANNIHVLPRHVPSSIRRSTGGVQDGLKPNEKRVGGPD